MKSRSPVSVDLALVRALRVDVASRSAPTARGLVRVVSSDELRARFQPASAKLPLGTFVSLRFSGPPLRGVITSTANVIERRDEERHREYVFKLARPEEIVPALLPHIQKIGNRRDAVRIRPSVPIAVRLFGESGASLCASLFDLSASGMSLRVSAGEEETLASSTMVDLRAQLPGRPPLELHLRASIRERRYIGALVHLGLAFVPEQSDDFPAQEQAILQFVFATCADLQGTPLPGRFGGVKPSDR